MGAAHIIVKGDFMPDYKEMYLTMVDATEDVINTLIQAQRRCEELYISSSEPEIRVLETNSPGDRRKDG